MDIYMRGDAALKELNGDNDILGVKVFAEKIAQSIFKQCTKGKKSQSVADQSLVFGLEGAWGSGKSSLKNEILKQIRILSKGSKTRKPIIVEFDPWIQRGVQPLVGALLEEIKSAVISAGIASGEIKQVTSGQLKWIGSKTAEYRDVISSLAEFSATIVSETLPIPYLKAVTAGIGQIASHMPKRADDPSLSVRSLKQQKKEVNASLEQLAETLIISIDDIDRLDPQEIMEVMRLVRSVADFSNTIYLLNYDPRIVTLAAKEAHGVIGSRNYLDKIVNVPIRVPVPEAFDLRAWFEKEFLEILQEWHSEHGFPHFKDDQNDLHGAVSSAGNIFLRTPRDVRRALDSVRLTLSSLTRRLWPADLAWISIIKIGSTELHNWIERYLTEMAHIAENDATATRTDVMMFDSELGKIAVGLGSSKRYLRRFLGERLGSIREEKRKIEIDQTTPFVFEMRGLFDQTFANSLPDITKFRRLASPYDYKFYFKFQSPVAAITDADERLLISSLNDGIETSHRFLVQLDNIRVGFLPSKLQHLFRYLKRQEAISFSPPQRRAFFGGLMKMLDDPSRFEEVGFMHSIRGWLEAAALLPKLLPETNDDESRAEIAESYQKGEAISWLTYVVRKCHNVRRQSDRDQWLSDWQFETAKDAILRRYAKLNLAELLLTARPTENFFAWSSLAQTEVTRDFMLKYSQYDGDFLSCLELIQGVATSAAWSNLDQPKTRYFLGVDSLQNFFDVPSTISRLEKLRDNYDAEGFSIRARAILNAIDEASQYRM